MEMEMKKDYVIKRICAYCGKVLGYTPGGTAPGTISHGACNNCYDEIMNEIDKGDYDTTIDELRKGDSNEYSKTNKG